MTTQRRRRVWVDSFIDQAGSAASGFDEVVLLDAGNDAENKGRTLIRNIIDLYITPTTSVANSTDVLEINLGIGMVSESTLAGSVRAGLEGDNPVSGWLWRTRTGISEDVGKPTHIQVDIRAQRKLLYGEPRLFIGYVAHSGPDFAVTTLGIIRSLYLLP